MLYQKWKEQVFVPLHSAIKLTLESTHSFNDAQLRQLFNQYLQIQNKKVNGYIMSLLQFIIPV